MNSDESIMLLNLFIRKSDVDSGTNPEEQMTLIVIHDGSLLDWELKDVLIKLAHETSRAKGLERVDMSVLLHAQEDVLRPFGISEIAVLDSLFEWVEIPRYQKL